MEAKERGYIETSLSKPLTADIKNAIRMSINSEEGEIASLDIAAAIANEYRVFDENSKQKFLLMLANECGVDRAQVRKAVRHFAESAFLNHDMKSEEKLRESTEMEVNKLFMRMAAVSNGLEVLIEIRALLLKMSKKELDSQKSLQNQNESVVKDISKFLQQLVRTGETTKKPTTFSGQSSIWKVQSPSGAAFPFSSGTDYFVETHEHHHPLILSSEDIIALTKMEKSLKALLLNYFNVGFLEFHQISWDSPASLLEKVVRYEAVHKIDNVAQLQHRVNRLDRRCFALFHMKMPEEPLVTVHVAMISNIPSQTQEILDQKLELLPPSDARVAVFYSISNSHFGLSGIGFGNFLIRRAMTEIKEKFQHLSTFVTLSPIPKFMDWLLKPNNSAVIQQILSEDEINALFNLLPASEKAERFIEFREPQLMLLTILANPSWHEDVQTRKILEKPMVKICAKYLYGPHTSHATIDPVAKFHLNNGARIERLNWAADLYSEKTMRESAGIMVNYQYVPSDLGINHQMFVKNNIIRSSQTFLALVAPPPPPKSKL